MTLTERELLRGFVGPRFTRRGPVNIEDLNRLQLALMRKHVGCRFDSTFHYQPPRPP